MKIKFKILEGEIHEGVGDTEEEAFADARSSAVFDLLERGYDKSYEVKPKTYPSAWLVRGVCDMCDYFLGEEKGDGNAGHCGWDGTEYRDDGSNGEGLCGCNAKKIDDKNN